MTDSNNPQSSAADSEAVPLATARGRLDPLVNLMVDRALARRCLFEDGDSQGVSRFQDRIMNLSDQTNLKSFLA